MNVINAACDKKVRLIGDFFTQIIHNKVLYKIIHLPETLAMLTRKEQLYVYHHVPYTMMLSKDNIDDVIRNKDRWILKPEDSYGSKGVYAGVEYSQAEWEQKVRGVKMGEYILQEFCMPYTNYNYEFDGNNLNRIKFYNLTGMYVYNGESSRECIHEFQNLLSYLLSTVKWRYRLLLWTKHKFYI